MFGVVLAHASQTVCGADLVSRRFHRYDDAADHADMVQRLQPGSRAIVAVLTEDGWMFEGLPIRDWLAKWGD